MIRRGVLINSTLVIVILIIFLAGLSVVAQNENTTENQEQTKEQTQVGVQEEVKVDSDVKNEVVNVGIEEDKEKEDESEVGVKEKSEDSEDSGEEIDGGEVIRDEEERVNEINEISDEEVEEELNAGITPDSFFYFIDELFDGLQNCIDNREEKAAEIKAMIEAGKIEEAKESLKKYEKCAEEVEKEATPDEKERIEKSSRLIRKAIKNIEDKIPENDKEDFGDIINREERIEKAAQVAAKIKNLCEELSSLDPLEYSRVCKVDQDDVPEWRKKHHQELTEDQKKEAKEFGQVMSECFKTQGRDCRCEDIKIKPFADRCSLIAPLASKCEGGDEDSCEAMNEATEGMEDLLPDYLLDVMYEIEEKYREDEFDLHLPKECKDEGATNVKKCTEVMFRRNAPGPCLNALDRGEITFENEREAREVCEKIMFEDNAPQECIDAGLKDHRECGKLMFKNNAPQECMDAGLSGESPKDMRKCEEIMRESNDKEGGGFGPPEHAVAGGFRCKNIQNSDERLKCYDEELSRAGDRGKRYEEHYESRGPSGGWPEPCREKQALTRESCEKVMIERSKDRFKDTQKNQESFARDCKEKGGRWDCSFGDVSEEPCKCFFDENRRVEDFKRGEDQFKSRQEDERKFAEECSSRGGRWDCRDGKCNCFVENQPPSDFRPPEQHPFEQQPPGTQPPSQTETQPSISDAESGDQQAHEGTSTGSGTGTEGTSSGTSGSFDSSGSSSESSGGSGSGGETSGVTGGVIFNNDFLNYYYK